MIDILIDDEEYVLLRREVLFILWCLIHLYAYVNNNRCCWRAHHFDAEWMHSASILIDSTAADAASAELISSFYSSCCRRRVKV